MGNIDHLGNRHIAAGCHRSEDGRVAVRIVAQTGVTL